MNFRRIILVGAGNVGYHLGLALHAAGVEIGQIFSRTIAKAQHLASQTGAAYTTHLREIDPHGDLYILAVRDSAIQPVARELAKLPLEGELVVHTSGATPASVLESCFSQVGVFYPLQTFSRDRQVDFAKIPICVYANTAGNSGALAELARCLSRKVYQLDDHQRAVLHVAAVFANNFSNHLFYVSEKILEPEGLPFDLLRPLIRETAAKVQHHSPRSMQTGPAIRGDHETIRRHLDLLKAFPEYHSLYRELTKSINPEIKAFD